MKVVVNELNTCKRGLEVEVPGQLVHEELERALRDYSHRARLPGFRPGRIPLDIVRRRFGKEVREEVVQRMVREYAVRALEDKKLQPVRDPVLDEVRYEAGQPLVFKATFEVRPPISVSDYHHIPLTTRRHAVADDMVETSVRGLAERAAKLEAVTGRPVQKGDFVVGSLSCRFVRGQGKDLHDEPMLLEAGAETNHPDFNAALLGLEAGASRSFETRYPDDYNAESLRGRTVAYTLSVKEIKKKILPEVNDELARELGNFQSLAELKDKVRSELERRAHEAERAEAREALLAELVKRHPIEVPESLVETEVEARLEGIVREMMARGMDPTKAPLNWREEREKLRPGAVDAVRAMLLLEAIAGQEGIEATEDDVNIWLRDEARRHNVSIPALKERLSENARLAGLRRQIVREKSLDFLLNDATITHEGK
ncbi:MAG TPA: trigger factor [Candidatus Polarisedimenticolia bacterium]|nr:trigger factor [Candidatus Polarisedimenticolia bacterium]